MGEWIFQEQFIDSSHLSESIIWFILKCKISGGVIEVFHSFKIVG